MRPHESAVVAKPLPSCPADGVVRVRLVTVEAGTSPVCSQRRGRLQTPEASRATGPVRRGSYAGRVFAFLRDHTWESRPKEAHGDTD